MLIYTRNASGKFKLFSEIRKLRNFARRNRWKVSGVYTDRGEETEAHPEFDRALENLRAGKAKGILVPRISMCVASLKEAVVLLDSLHRDAFCLVSMEDDFDSEKASSAETIRVLAKLERELFSNRVKSGLASARAEGQQLGRPKLKISENRVLRLAKRKSIRQIARTTGYSQTTVWRVLQKHNRK
ncbi:MAG: recombinase family protein [Candidatus Eisenbacteria bacterium]|uniref:Recombinase family protein n=1 Tax=Eiseniibacteriota bacterium TaxID=2212470 RepID=A0A7Y2EDS9_UNCEI|nr:recombinase family protein [Candidatus Eisenbacteria bacterium]